MKSYYDTLQKQISEFTGIDIDKIILSKYSSVDIVEDEKEFGKIKKMIESKGYVGYRKYRGYRDYIEGCLAVQTEE